MLTPIVQNTETVTLKSLTKRKVTTYSHHTFYLNQYKVKKAKTEDPRGLCWCQFKGRKRPRTWSGCAMHWIWKCRPKLCRVFCSQSVTVLGHSSTCAAVTGNYSHVSIPTIIPVLFDCIPATLETLFKVHVADDASSKALFKMWGSNSEKLSDE